MSHPDACSDRLTYHQIKGQRSFNWQSIAFVMRRLWVQIPPLALFVLGILTENESPFANVV